MVIQMKFDEMVSNKKATNKASKIRLLLIIGVSVVVIVILYFVFKLIFSGNNTKNKVVTLDKNSRLVQSLYTSVHDFKSSSPNWMYSNEKSSIIADMTEDNKMVLAYLNLKGTDFLAADDCSSLPNENSYGKLVCSDKTIIKREDVERSYKEVFGDKFMMSTGSMKVNPDNDTYVYNEDIDSYVLYSKNKDEEPFSKDFTYDYDIYRAERDGNTVRIYESLDVSDKTNTVVESAKYLYTFVMSDDNLYSYYSIESVK